MPPLWKPESWEERLAELEARSGERKEAPLRRDVRSLGLLLGRVLREQAGDALFERVEQLRQSAIRRREAQTQGRTREAEDLMQMAVLAVSALPVDEAYRLSRAFAFYFELINLAETNHRKRRRLAIQLDQNAAPQRGDLRGTLRRLREAGLDAAQAYDFLKRICITPVFTAHPTEVARRSVMFKRRRISDLLEQLDRIPVPAPQLEALERNLIAEITALWQTDDVRSARPTVRDEIRMAIDYYETSLFDTLPVLYSEVASALAAEYPDSKTDAQPVAISRLPQLVRFGSWIGGDRDGNPFVIPEVTRESLAMAHNLLLNHYRRRLQNVFEQLGSSIQQVPVSAEVTALLGRYLDKLRAAGQTAVEQRFHYEHLRLLIACIMMRLLVSQHTNWGRGLILLAGI